MTLAEVKEILRIFSDEAKIPFFSFTGGEPLLRDDLEDMIRHARSLGLQVNLVTNGTLAERRRARSLFRQACARRRSAWKALTSAPMMGSLRGPDRGRGRWQGSRNLQDAGISVQTNTTVTDLTYRHAASMPAFLKGLGVRRFAMNLYIPSGGSRFEKNGGSSTEAAAADDLFIPYSRAADASG